MAIDIEAIERAMAVAREAVKRDGTESVFTTSNTGTKHPNIIVQRQTPKVEIKTKIGKKPATIEATPVESMRDPLRARAVRFALTRPDCGTQTRVAIFDRPVTFASGGIFVERGKGREFHLEPFDMSKVFGDGKDQKQLRAKGVHFR